ncbi:MAG: TonB C-terminal domain-containing protein [Gemmatimonadota bacterium]
MRYRDAPGKKSLLASAAIHVVALVLAWYAQASAPDVEDFVTYQIDIVSPPPTQMAETPAPLQEEELVVEAPDPIPPPEEPEPDPVVEETPTREESRPDPTPTPPLPDPEPEEEAGDPDPSETESGEDINVRMEGLRRDYPAYYENIIRQMNRCMRFNGPGGLKTSVYFEIDRDGNVNPRRVEFVSRSGNAGFDFAVMEAVECAGSGRLGALPPELGLDRFPIIFEVTSSRRAPEEALPMHPWLP